MLEHLAQSSLPGVLSARPLVDLDPGPRRQTLQCVGEAEPLAAHDEAEDVAALPTAEAVPAVARRGHDEAGGLLAVERAEPLVGGARLAQFHLLADDLEDRELALHFGGNAYGQMHLLLIRRPTSPRRSLFAISTELDRSDHPTGGPALAA